MLLLCCDFVRLFPHDLERHQKVASVEPELDAKEADQNNQQDGGKLPGKDIGRRIGFRKRMRSETILANCPS
jgi:hypothetical protein